jgi:hypothetical protein
MSKLLLPVPHRTEAFPGACLPACCQMALAFLSITESQASIATQIGHVEGAGTPARNITRLEVFGVEVEWNRRGTIDDVQRAIADGYVPIVFLRTGELPYWDHDTPHAVVVVGIEADTVSMNDPAFENAPIPVLAGDFQLAWDEFGCQWAAIRRLP